MCKCSPDCAMFPSMGYSGYFYAHAPENVVETIELKRHKTEVRQRTASRLHSIVVPLTEDEIKLQKFFANAAQELMRHPFCQNCKSRIPQAYFRAATAHVLPKRKEYGFPSIASHPANKLFLGAGCGCHYLYDRSWEDAAKMVVWPLAVAAFKELYPFIAENEKKNIPDILRHSLLETNSFKPSGTIDRQ